MPDSRLSDALSAVPPVWLLLVIVAEQERQNGFSKRSKICDRPR
jgi:hypothetical protein